MSDGRQMLGREVVICAAHPQARIALQAGSFIDAAPAGADVYLLIRVLMVSSNLTARAAFL